MSLRLHLPKLYGVLEQHGHRALNYDTYSVIYVSEYEDWGPETGVYLGELTEELDGDYNIPTFVRDDRITMVMNLVAGRLTVS